VSYTWSYSSISLFQQCPRKYHRLRIVKDIVEPPQEHLLYGTAVHRAAEEFIRDDKDLPPKFEMFKPQLTLMKVLKGDKYCEYEMGIRKDFTPCAFDDPDVWLRGIVDLLVVGSDSARIIDYKTSKSSEYADTKQLELLSLLVFKHFPQVKKIKGGLLFLVAKDLVGAEYIEEHQGTAWLRWLDIVRYLESAMKTGVWNPKPNFTCRKFCAVKDCEHNGRSPY
jgi:hypothetical protein